MKGSITRAAHLVVEMYVYGRVLEHWVGYYYIREYGVVSVAVVVGLGATAAAAAADPT